MSKTPRRRRIELVKLRSFCHGGGQIARHGQRFVAISRDDCGDGDRAFVDFRSSRIGGAFRRMVRNAMSAATLTLSLDEKQTGYVDDLVRSGRYATPLEVVQAGLSALQAHDAARESWLHDEVVPVAAAMMADPTQAIPLDEVFAEIEQLHASRVSKGGA